MVYDDGSGVSRECEEEGEELVRFDRVLDIEFSEGRNQVDQILGGHEDACPVLAAEVVDVLLLEELDIAGLGSLELPR
jgi:hypothetical protein